jgi:hypothetical protein
VLAELLRRELESEASKAVVQTLIQGLPFASDKKKLDAVTTQLRDRITHEVYKSSNIRAERQKRAEDARRLRAIADLSSDA